jgi:2-polyprenyl-3-methyl-5-hydroxy-6-metoxy-1,4-benzoquinol methylase
MLARLYDSGWEHPDRNTRETGSTDAEIARRLVALLSATLAAPNFAGRRILDYGAGRGALTVELTKQGADVVAIEPFGYDFLAKLGFPVYRDLAELPDSLLFDGIVSVEVVEHLRDPCGTLTRLHERLSSGGWLLVTTPNAAGLPAKLMGQRWREAAKPGHIVFFTPATLGEILRNSGFKHAQRVRWFIRYPHASPLRALIQLGLQALAIDGGLRMMAYRE